MNKVITLTGDFSKSRHVAACMDELEAARAVLATHPHGSGDWHEAKIAVDEAKREHAKAIKALRE